MTDLIFPELDMAARETLRAVEPWPPEGAVEAMRVQVYGEPRPSGSKTATAPAQKDPKTKKTKTNAIGQPIPVYYRDKNTGAWKILVHVRDSSDSTAWRKAIKTKVHDAWADDPMVGQALALELTFVLTRPKLQTGAQGLKPSALIHPIVRPDVLKLTRTVEDALTEVLYEDDAAIVDERMRKIYCDPGEEEHVEIRVWRLPTTIAELTAL